MLFPFTSRSIRTTLLIKASFQAFQAHMAVPGTNPCHTPNTALGCLYKNNHRSPQRTPKQGYTQQFYPLPFIDPIQREVFSGFSMRNRGILETEPGQSQSDREQRPLIRVQYAARSTTQLLKTRDQRDFRSQSAEQLLK